MCFSTVTIPLNTMVEDHGDETKFNQACGFKSLHPGGANAMMGDGSAHFLSETIDYRLWCGLGTIAGNEMAIVPD